MSNSSVYILLPVVIHFEVNGFNVPSTIRANNFIISPYTLNWRERPGKCTAASATYKWININNLPSAIKTYILRY